MILVFASSNQHKIDEITAMLPSYIQLLGLKEIGFTDEIAETAETIEGNAKLKAECVYQFIKNNTSLPLIDGVFADDSGLEVSALGGQPGVFSARYAGEPKNDAANNQKLLKELDQKTARQAQFKTVISLLLKNEYRCFEGIVKGTIAFEPRGNQGFGYDPLFIPQGYRSTFAELGNDIKNSISHRANAVKKLVLFSSEKSE
jgi:XTP/dITP diphosphohydrolase